MKFCCRPPHMTGCVCLPNRSGSKDNTQESNLSSFRSAWEFLRFAVPPVLWDYYLMATFHSASLRRMLASQSPLSPPPAAAGEKYGCINEHFRKHSGKTKNKELLFWIFRFLWCYSQLFLRNMCSVFIVKQNILFFFYPDSHYVLAKAFLCGESAFSVAHTSSKVSYYLCSCETSYNKDVVLLIFLSETRWLLII